MNALDKMKFGYVLGIGLLIIGIIFISINVRSISQDNSYFPKMLTVGITVVFMSVAFFIFPGGNFTKADYPDKKINLQFIWQAAPPKHRIMWIIFSAVGFIYGLIQTSRPSLPFKIISFLNSF